MQRSVAGRSLVALCLALAPMPALAEAPIKIRVVVVTMFEHGSDTGDRPGEFQFWVEREKLDRVIPFPAGYRDLRLNPEKGILGIVTGAGVTNATAAIMALGADARQVLALVVGQGLMLTSIGTVAGLAGAVVLSRWIEGLLFGVSPTDPLTFAAVIAVLVAVATAACSIPAWRATRVDPTQALRAE